MQYSNSYLKDLDENVQAFEVLFRKLKQKVILVTGAAGLIGSACVDLLLYGSQKYNLGLEVYATGRNMAKLQKRFEYWKDSVFLQEYDVNQPFLFEKHLDYVLHCAGNAHPAAYATLPVETLLTAVCGVQNLLHRTKDMGCRVLYVSSSEVYGNKEDNCPYTEDKYYDVDILNARACYPSGKRAAETLCCSYAEEYRADVVIVRPGHVYGPTMTTEDTRASALFFRDVFHGQDIVMKSAGQQLRSYCYVMDCATAMLTVMLEGKTGEAYNISNKDSVVTIREMAMTVAEVSGKEVRFEQPSIQEKKGYTLMKVSALNAEKLEQLGWIGRYTMRRGAELTLKIMQENR